MLFRKKSVNDDDFAFLKQVNNDVEACIVESLLNSCDIPVMLNYTTDIAAAKVIIGKSMSPVDIYVQKDKIDLAKEILSSEE